VKDFFKKILNSSLSSKQAVVDDDDRIIRLQNAVYADFLARKKAEYMERLANKDRSWCDNASRIMIISRLLDGRQVEYQEVYNEVYEKLGVHFVHLQFENAWGVIKDYAETGGSKVTPARQS
jgi:hypothetical protein